MVIHPLADVSPQAQLGRDVVIGPFSIVESDVILGDRCRIEAHVVIKRGTVLGPDNHVHEGAVLGSLPQHLHMPDRPGKLIVGAHNTIREHCTLHRALNEGHVTRIGDHNLLMVNVHIAHDCQLGDHTIFANNVMLAGHVEVHDRAYLSGAVAVHQFCRIGRLAMVGGGARVLKDVPPYVTIDGGTGFVVGLNLVGLRRAGFDRESIALLKEAYRTIYRQGVPWNAVIEALDEQFPEGPPAAFREFFAGGQRGFVRERRLPPGATLKLRSDDRPDDAMPKRLAG